MFETLPKLNGTAKVELIINGLSIIVEVNGNDAPITAGNFVDLVQRGVYDGLSFHRLVPDFVVQGGDPQSRDPNFTGTLGTGGFIDPATGEERTIPLEIKLQGNAEPTYSTELGRLAGNPTPPDVILPNDRGSIAMARSANPDSASSQFYFPLSDANFLDGDYAVFGNVVEGLDVIDNIAEGDRIEDAEVIEGIDNLALFGNFVGKVGYSNNNTLKGSDLEIVFALTGDDTLGSSANSLPDGEGTTILVGGSGNDEYRLSDNSTVVILENGNSSQDIAVVESLDINGDTSFIAEIDNRHLYVGDIQSDQYAILVDWQEPENRIESFVFSDNTTLSYDQVANSFNQSDNYLGNFTWEQLEQSNEIDLERIGLTPSSVNDAINQASVRASELELKAKPSPLNSPIYRFQNSKIPGTYLFVGEEERDRINENFADTFTEEGLAFKVAVEEGDDLIPLYRFQSTITPGTYLFAQEEERVSINENFADSFTEEGLAFYVYGADSGWARDFSRFQNSDRQGTYLYATGDERDNIRVNFPNFVEEGTAFEVDLI
ncbi:MAG: peptidylprolyl isomerase [Xenococcaceae cyanobacterium MO_188.B19]|nr:peptidylprolyl isomerase [Xenococcaceae cyanobacterium MO_188.B19]